MSLEIYALTKFTGVVIHDTVVGLWWVYAAGREPLAVPDGGVARFFAFDITDQIGQLVNPLDRWGRLIRSCYDSRPDTVMYEVARAARGVPEFAPTITPFFKRSCMLAHAWGSTTEDVDGIRYASETDRNAVAQAQSYETSVQRIFDAFINLLGWCRLSDQGLTLSGQKSPPFLGLLIREPGSSSPTTQELSRSQVGALIKTYIGAPAHPADARGLSSPS